MNRARIAALYREQERIAREQERIARELAEAFADGDDAQEDVPEPPKSSPQRRRKPRKVPRAPSYPAPLQPASDLARMRAEKMARRHGVG